MRPSKSGLGFRMSNADGEPGRAARAAPLASPLGKTEKERLLARLPALAAVKDDAKDFAMRDKSIPAPRAGKTVHEAFPPPQVPRPSVVPARGPLTVERFAPEGPIDMAPHLTVTFSEDMIAVTSIDEIANGALPVTLLPQPPGTWRWLGTRTLTFDPEAKRFPMATEYTVMVPAGTKAANGEVLEQPVRWTFNTSPPKIDESWPSSHSVPLDPVIFLSFNQGIDRITMLRNIELRSESGVVPIRMATDKEVEEDDTFQRLAKLPDNGRWLAFKPIAKLAPATKYTVHIKPGAKGTEGPLATTKDQSVTFSTFGRLEVTESECVREHETCMSHREFQAKSDHDDHKICTPLQAFKIGFSNAIDLAHFDPSMVTVTPAIPGMKVKIDGTDMTLRGRTTGRTKYTVKIAGTLTDEFGQTLGHNTVVPLNVGSAKPVLFDDEHRMVVLDPAAPRKYTVYSINEPLLHVQIYAVTPGDYEQYLAFAGDSERLHESKPPGRLVVDRVIPTKNVPDQPVATVVDLNPAFDSGLGNAIVVVREGRKLPEDWTPAEFSVWVQSTKLGLAAFVEADAITGWVTNLENGSPVENAEVWLLQRNSVALNLKIQGDAHTSRSVEPEGRGSRIEAEREPRISG
ncbi:MAG: Ig-like domain-containing protein, partial [Polyangiaceae bacterium]|nr:Ig-like domain-containing protein [Polyangiaceae bacterium]